MMENSNNKEALASPFYVYNQIVQKLAHQKNNNNTEN